MSTIIQIKRNSGTTAPTTSDLVIGEMAYAYDASNDGASGKLYIEAVNNASAADIHLIGGKYFTDLLDHTLGATTASSALLTDASSKIDVLNVDNITLNGNDVSTTNSNGNLTLTPNGTGIVSINKNDGFKLPAGTTAQRSGSPVAGQIRYNSTLSTFEGYGSAWGSLGGVIDVDQDTKITAESAAGQDEDVLTFYIGVSNSAVSQLILADGVLKPTTDNDIDLGTSSLEFKDAYFDGTVTTDGLTVSAATNLDGAIQVDNTLTVGVNDTGHDVKLFGATDGAYMLWDESVDDLILAGAARIVVPDSQLVLGSTAVTSTAAELNLLDGSSANSVVNSKAVIYGSGGQVAGTLSTAAQTNVTSLGTLTALTVDDVAINGKVVTMTGSSGDTATMTVGTNGTLDIVTVDTAAAAANIQITADGTVDIDSAGALTLDSGAAINLEPAAGSVILLDGTISVDAGVVTGATSITSTAFVGNITGDLTGTLQTAAQGNVTSLGTLSGLTVSGSTTLAATSFGDADITNVGDIQLDSITGDGDTNTAITFSGSDVITVSAAGSAQVTFTDGGIVPSSDNDIDLGSGSAEFKDLYLDGTANIDSLVADTADINGGTVDGVVIGGSSVATQISVDNLRLDGNTFSSTDSNGSISISPNGTGNVIAHTDNLSVQAGSGEGATVHVIAGEGENAQLLLSTDESDDAGDDWSILHAASNNQLKIGNDIASAGTQVAQITLTPHATVASSTTAIAGALTVAGVTTFSGAVNMGSQATTNVNIDSGAIDAVTLGTNSPITNAQIDDININGQTISTTASNNNIILTPHGTGDVVVNSDMLTITGTESEGAALKLSADESDDNGDDWLITHNFNNNQLSFNNDKSGGSVAQITLTPHATVASSTTAIHGHLTVAGDVTITGATTTTSSTNTTIADKLVELGTGSSGSASGDIGHIFERGDDANVFIGWDESLEALVVGTGTFTGSSSGDLSHTLAAAKFGSLTLTTDLAVAEGGTGVSSFTDKGIVYGDGSNALDVTAAPGGADVTTSFKILTSTTATGNPVWTTTIDGGTY